VRNSQKKFFEGIGGMVGREIPNLEKKEEKRFVPKGGHSGPRISSRKEGKGGLIASRKSR